MTFYSDRSIILKAFHLQVFTYLVHNAYFLMSNHNGGQTPVNYIFIRKSINANKSRTRRWKD